MSNNKELIQSYKKQKILLSSQIEEQEKELFKYRNRNDYSSFEAGKERLGNLKAKKLEIGKEIARLERIEKNDGVDPYSIIPQESNQLSDVPINKGQIKETAELSIKINGTKGKGENKETVKINEVQRIEKNSQIEGGEIVGQSTNVTNIKSPKKLGNIKSVSNEKNDLQSLNLPDIKESDKKPKKYTRTRIISSNGNFSRRNFFNHSPINKPVMTSSISNSSDIEIIDIDSKKPRKYTRKGGSPKNPIINKSVNKKSLNKKDKSNNHSNDDLKNELKSNNDKKWIKKDKYYMKNPNFEANSRNNNDLKGNSELPKKKWVRSGNKWVNEDLINKNSSKGNSELHNESEGKLGKNYVNEDLINKKHTITNSKIKENNTIKKDNINQKPKKTSNTNLNTIKKNNFKEKQKMNKILAFIEKNNSRVQASEFFDISIDVINDWYNKGLKGFSENTVYFYNRLSKIEENNKIKNAIEKNNMENILLFVERGNSRVQASEFFDIPIEVINDWYDNGSNGFNENTIHFYKRLSEIEKINLKEQSDERKEMDIILRNLRNGMTYEEACQNANVNMDTLELWRQMGIRKSRENTIYFYENLIRFEKNELETMNLFIDAFNKSHDKINALKAANLKESQFNSWIEDGKRNKTKNRIYFVKEWERINKDLESDEIKVDSNNPKRQYCPYCGNKIHPADKYCVYCGQKLSFKINTENEGVLDKIIKKINDFIKY